MCGYNFGEREQAEKERIEAELVEIKQKEFQQARLAEQKFGKSLEKNWEIAKARASVQGGKPLYKLLFYYAGTDVQNEDIIRISGVSSKEYYRALQWVKKQKNKIITRY